MPSTHSSSASPKPKSSTRSRSASPKPSTRSRSNSPKPKSSPKPESEFSILYMSSYDNGELDNFATYYVRVPSDDKYLLALKDHLNNKESIKEYQHDIDMKASEARLERTFFNALIATLVSQNGDDEEWQTAVNNMSTKASIFDEDCFKDAYGKWEDFIVINKDFKKKLVVPRDGPFYEIESVFDDE